jgi:hypothetical protein
LIRRLFLAVLVTALPLLGAMTAAVTSSAPPAGAASPTPAYWLVASDGGIFAFGGAPYFGSTGGTVLNKPIVGMTSTSPTDKNGYWLVASDGGIFSYGDAQFYGSTGSIRLNKPVVGMASTPSGHGYWLVASDGGIFSYGDAQFYGSTGSIRLNQPVVGMATTPSGHGYWLVAADGGIFSYGDAMFHGSTGSLVLNKPIVGMMPGPNGGGYFLVASDGGLFSFGTTNFYGSLGGVPLKHPIVSATVTPDFGGYWMTDSAGVVSNFGDATNYGSAPSALFRPIVGMAEAGGNGSFVGAIYPSGSYGYDVSKFQCGNLPSGDHAIAIVQVIGGISAPNNNYPNPCLKQEGDWAGAGLNLYAFFSNAGECADTTSCFNLGYNAAIDAFNKAVSAGLNANVPWWIDVEGGATYWSGDTALNAATVQGGLEALHNTEGIGNAGIYASPGVWNSIVGNYQPQVPYWMADWTKSGPTSCSQYASFAANNKLPTGLSIVQYDSGPNFDPSINYDEDYAC